MSGGASDEAGGVTWETGVSDVKGFEGTGGRVWRSGREESDRGGVFEGRRMRFLLSSLCLLSSLYFLFFAAAIAFGDSLSKWYWNVPTSSEANSSGPLQAARRGVSDAEQSPRATVEAGVASEQFLPGTQALRLENSTAEAGAGSERLGNRVEAAPPSPEALPAATTAVQFPVASELFDKAGRPSLPDTEARPSANSAARGKREEPLPEAPPAPNATRPDDPSSKQSASKVEDPSAPDAVAASPPIAMVQEGASSERVTSGEPIASRTAAVPSAASRYGAARTETAAYIAHAHAKIQQGDIAAARRLLERALGGSDDGDAWFVLAETYDPQMLAGWRVIGIKPDLEKAKTLYQEAQRRGAQGAPKRLLALRN